MLHMPLPVFYHLELAGIEVVFMEQFVEFSPVALGNTGRLRHVTIAMLACSTGVGHCSEGRSFTLLGPV